MHIWAFTLAASSYKPGAENWIEKNINANHKEEQIYKAIFWVSQK